MAELTRSSNPTGRGPGGPGRGPGRGPRRNRSASPESDAAAAGGEPGKELSEKVVFINRSAKVVKGGRRFSFSALVVAGDKQGRVGVGLGKAVEVSEAIRKGGDMAKQQMVSVSIKDSTIPHEILCHYGGAKVMLRPASPGTGIIAGKTVRAVVESAGIKDILSKSLGSNNPSNVVKATLAGLQQLRLREDVYRDRGLEIKKKPVAVPVPAAPVPATPVPPSSAAPSTPGGRAGSPLPAALSTEPSPPGRAGSPLPAAPQVKPAPPTPLAAPKPGEGGSAPPAAPSTPSTPSMPSTLSAPSTPLAAPKPGEGGPAAPAPPSTI